MVIPRYATLRAVKTAYYRLFLLLVMIIIPLIRFIKIGVCIATTRLLHNLLPVLRGQSRSNVDETGFATTSNERYKLHRCDVS